ncbi:MAG: hypothetical protein Q7T80_05735 [Methanoregula sp.]|nr:hypothetical protein [Methanoregula sp.]
MTTDPTLTLSCYGPDPVGTTRTFTATSDSGNYVWLYFDGTLVAEGYDQVGYTATASAPGSYTIEAVASNGCGSVTQVCTWYIFPVPLVVTLVNPSSSIVLDLPGTQRSFTASVNQPATISFYVDGSPTAAAQSSPDVQEATFEESNPPHTIRVVASNANGNAQNCWNWLEIHPIPPVTLVGTIVSSNGCHNTTDTVALIINNVYVQHYSDGTYAIQMDYNIGIGGTFLEEHWNIEGSLSLSVTISWPEISDPNNPPTNSISRTFAFGSPIQSGTITIPVPTPGSYYIVICQVSGTISGWTYGVNEEGLIVLPHKETATGSAQCEFQIIIPV